MKKSPLKRRKGLREVSPRQEQELDLREQVRQELIKKLKVKNGQYLCMRCDKPSDFRGLQLVHVRALSLGGKTSIENCRLWCASCHGGKNPGGHDLNDVKSKPMWSRRSNAY